MSFESSSELPPAQISALALGTLLEELDGANLNQFHRLVMVPTTNEALEIIQLSLQIEEAAARTVLEHSRLWHALALSTPKEFNIRALSEREQKILKEIEKIITLNIKNYLLANYQEDTLNKYFTHGSSEHS